MNTVISTTMAMLSLLKSRVNGHKIVIYCSPGTWIYDGDITDADLWDANWGVTIPRISMGWNEWKFWQYNVSEKGVVPGIKNKVDLDRFNGSLEELQNYISGVYIPPPPVTNKHAKCIIYSLRIRDQPSTNSRTIGGLKSGDIITVEKEINTGNDIWLKFLDEEKYCAKLYQGVTMMVLDK